MFFRGQKVVCISERWGWHCIGCELAHLLNFGPPPRKDKIYIITNMREVPEGLYLMLEGHHPTVGFHSQNFRPLVERKTDISVFETLLTPAPKVTENA